MESKLFKEFDLKNDNNKEFVEGLVFLLSLRTEQLNSILKALIPLYQCRTEGERRPIVETLEADTGLAPTDLQHVTNQANFFLNVLHREDMRNEKTALWANDLINNGIISADTVDRFTFFIENLKEQILDQMESMQRERKTEAGILPSFVGASTTIEIRGVFKEAYKWGKDLDAYTPEVVTVVPIVSIGILVDSGTTKQFNFQITPDEIEYLISELKSAQKCAAALVQSCGNLL